MILQMLLLVVAQFQPGPLDAFRANLASSRASLEFTCKVYYGNYGKQEVDILRRVKNGIGPAADPDFIINGRWECDGAVEHYTLRLRDVKKQRDDPSNGPIVSCEAIFDGETFAHRYFDPGGVMIHVVNPTLQSPVELIGPSAILSNYRLDGEIQSMNAEPNEHRQVTVDGEALELEVYEKANGEFRARKEIAYDPSLSYVPRYFRKLTYGEDAGRSIASVVEMWLLDAKVCSAGGYVPTEWYALRYHVDNFESKYPSLAFDTSFEPTSTSTLIHFAVTKFEDRTKGPVGFDGHEKSITLAAAGGALSIKNFKGRSLTMQAIKDRLGDRINKLSLPALPNIDENELHEFAHMSNVGLTWRAYLVLAAIAISACVLLRLGIKKYLAALLLASIFLGCDFKPVSRIKANFSPNHIIYNPMQTSISLPLEVDNAGNVPVTITRVNAGCSCRHIEPSQLPVTINPGQKSTLTFQMTNNFRYENQDMSLTFETDQGSLVAQASILSLPSHYVSPSAITLQNLYEGEESSEQPFELTHREVYGPGTKREATKLLIPTQFSSYLKETHSGKIASQPLYSYTDTTYVLTLENREAGLHKAEVVLNDHSGFNLIKTPVVWRRLPFVSSIPERVFLSKQSVRAFLHCPDETVELESVISSPNGVKAVITTSREISISLEVDAPDVIDGLIEVKTKSSRSPLLRIPVVRYSSSKERP